MISVESCTVRQTWDDYIVDNDGHPLQLWGWGEVKAVHNWYVDRIFVTDDDDIVGAAQLLIKVLPGGFTTLVYIPRGPVTTEKNRAVVLDQLSRYAKKQYKALALTIEPHWTTFEPPKGWRHSDNTILIPRTLIIDLTKTEDELMEAISRKRRYDIRRSTKDVADIRVVKTESDLRQCLAIYHETAKRAGFAIHGDDYYEDIFDRLGEYSQLVAAYNTDGEVIAFSWQVLSKAVAFELYGGSNQEGQKLMANYALKWWVIKKLKRDGVEAYDLNGLMNDGISHFKRSFSDHEDMLVGTYDKPLSPLYTMWNKGLPFAKKIVRAIRQK
jgi:lipid II:glycine glycyltransferase (peptidoglycan interpeptide bridge formation enzyme)